MPSSPCLITNAFCASVNFDAFIALRSIPSQENGTENSNSLRGHFREADQGDKHDWQVQKAWSKTIAMGVVPPDFSNGAVAMLPIRSEEHTSELQSLMRISYAVFCLKKKKK